VSSINSYKFLLKRYTGVLLDTSIIIQAIQDKVDLIRELKEEFGLKVYVPKSVLNELEKLKSKNIKMSNIVTLAIKSLKNKIEVLDISAKSTDDAIIKLASSNNFIVATNDSNLKDRLKMLGIPVIYINRDGYLSIE